MSVESGKRSAKIKTYALSENEQLIKQLSKEPFRLQINWRVCLSLGTLGAEIVVAVFIFLNSKKLEDFYRCKDGECSFGIFSTHMQYTMWFVNITSVILISVLALCTFYLILGAFVGFNKHNKKINLMFYAFNWLYFLPVVAAVLVCGALFSSDFVMKTTAAHNRGSDLILLRKAGISLFVFAVLAHIIEVFYR